jgi:autotransporter-associated beta strand protein
MKSFFPFARRKGSESAPLKDFAPRHRRASRILTTAIASLCLGAPVCSFAGVNFYLGEDTSWADPGTWSANHTPAAEDALSIDATVDPTVETSTLDGSYSVQTLTFGVTELYTLNANTGTQTTSRTLTLTAAGDELVTESGYEGSISFNSSGSDGTLIVDFGGTSAGAINVGSAQAAIYFGAGASVAGSHGILLDGPGTVSLGGVDTFTGGVTLDAGTLSLASVGAIAAGNTITFNGGTLQYTAATAGIDYSSIFSNAANQYYTVDTNGVNAVLASALGSAGGTFTKIGAGTLLLKAANTYTGSTAINGGALQLGVNDALPSTSALSLSNGGTLDLQSFNETVVSVNLVSGNIIGSGILTSTSDFSVQAGTISAVLAGNVGLDKTTTGTVILSGADTFTGAVNINAGALQLGDGSHSLTLSLGSVTVSNAASLIVEGMATLTGTGGASNGSGGSAIVFSNGGSLINSGSISSGAGGTAMRGRGH